MSMKYLCLHVVMYPCKPYVYLEEEYSSRGHSQWQAPKGNQGWCVQWIAKNSMWSMWPEWLKGREVRHSGERGNKPYRVGHSLVLGLCFEWNGGLLHRVRHDMILLMFYRMARATLAAGFRIDYKGGQVGTWRPYLQWSNGGKGPRIF